MARTIPTNVQSAMDTRYGTEPLVVLKIEWEDVTVYYSTKTLTVDATVCKPSINGIDNISSTAKVGSVGSYSSTSVTLIDDDSAIKARVNRYLLDGIRCTVYHHYVGTTLAEMVPILAGRLIEPNWSSGMFEFSIETEFQSEEVGYAPELDAFSGFNNDVAGKAWPLCFGTVLEVPAVRATKFGAESTLSFGWPLTSREIGNSANMLVPEYRTVNGQYIFPTDTDIELYIAGVKFAGQIKFGPVNYYKPSVTDAFNTYHFLTTLNTWRLEIAADGVNQAIDTAITIADRDSSDLDYDSLRVFWVEETEDLTGKYIYIATVPGKVNFVEYQEGGKCYCRQEWDELIVGGTIIAETAAIPRSDWLATYVLKVGEADYNKKAFNRPHTAQPFLTELVRNNAIVKDGFYLSKAAPMAQNEVGGKELHVCNLVPSSEIVDVWAYRTYNDKRIYAPVPITRYIKRLNYPLGGKTVTCLEFPVPLNRWESEQWEDQIYVSVRSSLSYNTAHAVQYIVENYTNLTVDASSFGEVATKVADFWMCFALEETIDAIDLIEEMAKQARCGLVNSNGIVKLVFLPDQPNSIIIDEDWAGAQTMQLSNSSLDDIRTKLICNWNKKHDAEYAFTYANNIATYGTFEEEIGVSMYNMEYCVSAFANFWGYRYSNIWRRVGFRTFLNALSREVYDGITVRLAEFSANDIGGVLEEVNHDSETDTIDITLEMASRKTDVDGAFEPIVDTGYWPGNPTPPDIKDPAHGRSEVDYIPPVLWNLEQDDEEETLNRFFQIVAPTSVERGTNMEIGIRLVDAEGELVSGTFGATIAIQSGDASDVINYSSILIVDGLWAVTDFQFTGGAGTDATVLVVSGADAEDVTHNIEVYDTQVTTMTWVLYPTGTAGSPLTRNTPFNISLTNGPPNQSVDIEFIHSNGSDKLYYGTTLIEVVSITLDGTGSYSGSWFVNGGTTEGHFVAMNAHDPTYIYGSAYGNQITVGGLGAIFAENTFSVSGSCSNTALSVVMGVLSAVQIGDPFELSATLYDAGVITPGISGSATIKAYDPDGAVYLDWVTGGPKGVVQADKTELVVAYEDSLWTYDGCELDWDGHTPTNLYFELELIAYDSDSSEEIVLTDDELVAVDTPAVKEFVITLDPADLTRGTPANLRVSARNDGEIVVLYAPAYSIDIDYVASDASDILSPIVILPGDWSSGEATVAVTVTGGTGQDTLEFQLLDVTEGYAGTLEVAIEPVWNNVSPSLTYGAYTSYNQGLTYIAEDDEFEGATRWNDLMSPSIAFHAGASMGSGVGSGQCKRAFQDRYSYPSCEAELRDTVRSYTISDPLKAGIQTGQLALDFFQSRIGYNETPVVSYSVGEYYYNGGNLRIGYSENFTDLNTVAKAASGPIILSMGLLNQYADDQGARTYNSFQQVWKIVGKDIVIPMPAELISFIAGMTGNTLYLSFYSTITPGGYQYPGYADGSEGAQEAGRGFYMFGYPNELKILT